MLSKEDSFHNPVMFLDQSNSKIPLNKIKPNANNYVNKVVNQKANNSTMIENLVNQALRCQSMSNTNIANFSKKIKTKVKQKQVIILILLL